VAGLGDHVEAGFAVVVKTGVAAGAGVVVGAAAEGV